MKPFRLSKFMTIPPSDERKLLETVEADDAPFDSEASRKSRVKHQKVKTGCYTCKYATLISMLQNYAIHAMLARADY